MAVPAVLAQDFSVRFGDFQALERLNLEITQGAFVAIVGPNGAGKSTFLKSLMGIAEGSTKDGTTQTLGTLKVMGHSPQQLPPGQVGYVPQVKSFDRSFPALALEVVVSGLRRGWPFWITREERSRAEAMLEKVGASKLAKRRLGRLSGGELQRVYLARALIREPQLLLLDEPATGVDAVGEADLYRHLDAYQNSSKSTRPTILMITHDWEAAEHHASEVFLMNRKVIALAAPRTALSHENLALAFGHMGHKHGQRMG